MSKINRRHLFQAGAAAGMLAGAPAPAATVQRRGQGPEVYTRIGVRPFINCTSTYTINGGSAQLPEVIAAVQQAAHYHVNLDELQDAVGKRIAQLLGAEAAMVSSGAAGAVTCGTAACVAGGDPEVMHQLPNTEGIRNEVIVPKWSRSQYDQAVRNVGIRMVEVQTLDDVERALGPKTVMATGQANLQEAGNPFTLEQFVAVLNKRKIPLLIDAAAELPLRPNPFLSRGASLVAHSGGKILRGPQTAGILLGRKDLVTAAYRCSSPHMTFARAIKVSKEEIVGVLVAVEYLVERRDRNAEDREWRSWFQHIAERLKPIEGVRTKIVDPPLPSYYPVLNIEWDPARIGLINAEVGKQLLDGEPRIMSHAEGDGHSFVLRPAAMYPGEHLAVADRLYEVFRGAPAGKPKPAMTPPAVDLTGSWEVDLRFIAAHSRQKFFLSVHGNQLSGTFSSRIIDHGKVQGEIDGEKVAFQTRARYEGASFHYRFSGTVRGDRMSGQVELGEEYGTAEWTARRLA